MLRWFVPRTIRRDRDDSDMAETDKIPDGDEPPPDVKPFEVTQDPPPDQGNADAELKEESDVVG